jgi:hypothetical protein
MERKIFKDPPFQQNFGDGHAKEEEGEERGGEGGKEVSLL